MEEDVFATFVNNLNIYRKLIGNLHQYNFFKLSKNDPGLKYTFIVVYL
jgi:hypothetical protein